MDRENTRQLMEDNKSLRETLDTAQKRMGALESTNQKLPTEVATLTKSVEVMEKKEAVLNKKVKELEAKHYDLEQYTRKFNLEIYEIPECEQEDVEALVLDLIGHLETDLQPEDIDIATACFKVKVNQNQL